MPNTKTMQQDAPGALQQVVAQYPGAARLLTHHLDLVVDIWNAVRNMGPLPGPRSIIFNPVYGCNLNCSFCSYKSENARFVFCDFEKAIDLVSRLVSDGAQSIEVTGGGEPTIHPKFLDMICRFSEMGLDIGILTNGILASEEYASIIVQLCKWVRVSLYQDGDTMSDQMRGVINLSDAKLKYGSDCTVGVKFSMTRENYEWVMGMAHRCAVCSSAKPSRIAGVDRIEVKKVAGEKLGNKDRLADDLKSMGVITDLEDPQYVEDFWCWIAPVQVAIDPYLNMHYCCNYQCDYRKLPEWGSNHHMEMICNMRGNNVMSCFGNKYSKCRIIQYNLAAEALLGRPGWTLVDEHRRFL